jgi:hypothetical protein
MKLSILRQREKKLEHNTVSQQRVLNPLTRCKIHNCATTREHESKEKCGRKFVAFVSLTYNCDL